MWGKNLLFGNIIVENYMEMKDIGPRSALPWRPFGSANVFSKGSNVHGVGVGVWCWLLKPLQWEWRGTFQSKKKLKYQLTTHLEEVMKKSNFLLY